MKLEAESLFGSPFGGKQAVVGFTPGDVSLSERADIGCVLLSSAVSAGEVLHSANAAVELSLPPGSGKVAFGVGRLAIWLSPRSWLLQCALEDEEPLAAQINAAFPDKVLHAARFTDYLVWVELAGAGAYALLQEGGYVSLEAEGLPVHHAKRTLLAGIAIVVVRSGPDCWLIGVERSRSCYFVNWLQSCAKAGSPSLVQRT